MQVSFIPGTFSKKIFVEQREENVLPRAGLTSHLVLYESFVGKLDETSSMTRGSMMLVT